MWGQAPEGGRVYVDAAAAEDGDGTLAAPFATLDEALADVRGSSVRSIALTPGDYDGWLQLNNEESEKLDSGLEFAGCGREQTRLHGVTAVPQGETEEQLQPVFHITGESTADIVIRDLSVVGGRRAVTVWTGAGSQGPVVLERVDLVDSLRIAVVVDGMLSAARLLDVRIDGVEQEFGRFGWGVAIQTGMQLDEDIPEATVLRGVDVSGTGGLGVLADGAWVEIEDTRVTDVEASESGRGRGIQLQQFTMGTLSGVEIAGAADAALFLESPGRNGEPIEVLDSLLGPTLEAELPEQPGQSAADGLVITQYAEGDPYPASGFQAVLDGTELTGNSRAHVLVEAATLEVGPDNVFGKGAGLPLASQGDAEVQGIGGGEPGHTVEELGEDAALGLVREPLELDDLSGE